MHCLFVLRVWIAILGIGLLTACATVTQTSIPTEVMPGKSIYSKASITGLLFRDMRISQKVDVTAAGSQVGSYANNRQYAALGSSTANANATSVVWETFDNTILQTELKHDVEDAMLAQKVLDNAQVVFDGEIVKMGPSTGFGKISWNVFNTLSCLFFFGSPYVGSTTADIKLRVYVDHQLVATSRGYGTAAWLKHFFTGLDGIKQEARVTAAQLAIQDAVGKLSEQYRSSK